MTRLVLSAVLAAFVFSGAAAPETPTWWHPPVQMNWQWQLTTPVDQSVSVAMYDIDLFDNDASVVTSLHAAGRKVMCYVEVGARESYRSDAATFPTAIIGNVMEGYPQERYVDIRSPLLRPIIQARFDLCQAKGFDGIEPDIDDSYTENTGFPLTRADQIAYNTWFAGEAHVRGLTVLLKNGPLIATDLASVFDGVLDEQCFQYSECAQFSSFISLGKPVFEVEYSLATSAFCPQANALNFNAMKKNVSLNAARTPCRDIAVAPSPTASPTPSPSSTTSPTASPTSPPTPMPSPVPTPTPITSCRVWVEINRIAQWLDKPIAFCQ